MQSLSMSDAHSLQDFEQDALSHPDVVDLVRDRLEELRKRLLDASRRNPLINIKFRPNSSSVMRVIDELPDILRHNLTSGTAMRLVSLPPLEEELPAEQTDDFQETLFLARKEDEEYLAAIDKLDTSDKDADEDLREDNESILDMANVTFMPVRQLRWHYRSRHSGLIQFSNKWMYDSKLTIFPSAEEDHPDLGVDLVQTNGTYKSRTNGIEARAVVTAAIRHMETQPDLSLGICTMNIDQKDLILEEFERERDRNRKVQDYIGRWEEENDALEEFFIKNLETIQGDERDVMFISTLYGPETPGGRPHQRFGPVNSVNGHRRLNVLFTRAKRKIVTFTSLLPSDILVDENKNKGVRMFRAWLEYCKTGFVADDVGAGGDTDSPFEDYVIRQIESLGCEAVPQVGAAGYRIDIGVRHPDWPYGFIMGVECDGATYHSSKSSRDRDRLRQEVLEGLGWHLHRIWSTDWFNDPRSERDIIKEKIDARMAALKAEDHRRSKMRADDAAETVAREMLSRIDDTAESDADAADAAPGDRARDGVDDASHPAKTQVASHPPTRPSQQSLPIGDPTGDDLFSHPATHAADAAAATQIAKVLEDTDPIVEVGSKVTVERLSDKGGKMIFTIVDRQSDPDNGLVGSHTPLGQALIDAQEGDEVEYVIGSYVKNVRIISVEPTFGPQDSLGQSGRVQAKEG